MNIKQRILLEAEKDYKKFTAALIPNIDNVLGVRLPILRKLAKEIYTNENWEEFLQCKNCEFMEEIMLQGMIIGLIKQEPSKILDYIKNSSLKLIIGLFVTVFAVDLNLQKIIKNLFGNLFNHILNLKMNMTFVLAM